MITIISPAKKQDFGLSEINVCSQPAYLSDAKILIERLRALSQLDLMRLMSISKQLAELNYNRYRYFAPPFSLQNAKQALLAFKGDVYGSMDISNYSSEDFDFAQKHLRILSGLYGVLRPLDLVQAYRLEMGTKLANEHGNNLYSFWRDKLSENINQDEDKVLVNLASNEYFKAIDKSTLKAQVLQISFKENKNGIYKIIGIYAKKARGLMANFIIKNRINDIKLLKKFNAATYHFNPKFSSQWHWVFTR